MLRHVVTLNESTLADAANVSLVLRVNLLVTVQRRRIGKDLVTDLTLNLGLAVGPNDAGVLRIGPSSASLSP